MLERWTGPEGTYHNDNTEFKPSQDDISKSESRKNERAQIRQIISREMNVTPKDLSSLEQALENLNQDINQEQARPAEVRSETALKDLEELRSKLADVIQDLRLVAMRDDAAKKTEKGDWKRFFKM